MNDDLPNPGPKKPTTTSTKAGFWSVFLMTLGIQFVGTVTRWNKATRFGLGNALQATVVMGCMYLLLAMCFAELSSIVAFAGGSFGYCRAALGPFWGFMVGASEMLQNFLFVMVTVMSFAHTCTLLLGVTRLLEPLWMALAYALMFGVHLRGGRLFWYTVMVSGGVTVLLIVITCCGAMKTINVEKYGMPDGKLFHGDAHDSVGSLYFCAWFYIGLEIVPQTCEHVKNVSKHLTRGMVYSTAFTMVIALWVVMAATCNHPGITRAFYMNDHPLQEIFKRDFNLSERGSVFVSLMPLLSSAIGFMWGCGYQVAALARSGLLPSVFAKVFGENETPYVALGSSVLLQFTVALILWFVAPYQGPHVLHEAVMLGGSIVYIGMFAAFIIFRVRFESMKRNWVSPAGVPGAVVGMFLAALLFISAAAYQPTKLSLAVYFPWMAMAGVYYMAYAQHTQYFSAEEQMKFMKAYILNANKSKGRGRSASLSSSSSFYRFLDPLFVPVSRMFGISASISRTRGGSSLSGTRNGSLPSSPKHCASPKAGSPKRKRNTITPVDVEVPKLTLQLPPTISLQPILLAADTLDEELGLPRVDLASPLKEDQLQEPQNTSVRSPELKLASFPTAAVSQRGQRCGGGSALRSSFLAAGAMMPMTSSSKSTRVGWSGKVMTMSESKKFFDVLTTRDTTDENVAEKLIEALPNQFTPVVPPEVSEVPIRQEISIGGEDSDNDDGAPRRLPSSFRVVPLPALPSLSTSASNALGAHEAP